MLICPIFSTHKKQKHYLLNAQNNLDIHTTLKRKENKNCLAKNTKKWVENLSDSLFKNLTGIGW